MIEKKSQNRQSAALEVWGSFAAHMVCAPPEHLQIEKGRRKSHPPRTRHSHPLTRVQAPNTAGKPACD
jgi:hypothetical protein